MMFSRCLKRKDGETRYRNHQPMKKMVFFSVEFQGKKYDFEAMKKILRFG